MKTVMIAIARMGSSRLPGKVMMEFTENRLVIDCVVAAGLMSDRIDEVVVATTTNTRDDVIEKWCEEPGIRCYRGSEDDVLSRFTEAAEWVGADVAVRVTCDCPFLDPGVISEVVALREATGADYASNIDPPTWPDGLDCEAITIGALRAANAEAIRKSDRECVTTFISRNRDRFKSAALICPIPGLHKERWVLDTRLDLVFCKELASKVPPGIPYTTILKTLNDDPELRKINAHHPRNERFFDSIVKEEPIERSHSQSKLQLKKVQELIPLGTQTFSKSYLQYPTEAPLFVTHGNGGLLYDIDGNEYVDLVSGLLPNVLGYRDPDVDYAIRDQLTRGISFSVATALEFELASKLKRIIPCAEMSRFGKNGTDVTTAAIRLARSITGRDKILTSGYHGWADWSIALDDLRNGGVPRNIGDNTTVFPYGNIQQVHNLLGSRQFACVIVEPESNQGFLQELRSICNKTGTLLIFDEIITGFRIKDMSAQKHYKVIPDLATFGKAMGNGMPISALVGLHTYMQYMTDICFSGTFFGEALSLAAAIATIDKIERENVIDDLYRKHEVVRESIKQYSNIFEMGCVSVSTTGMKRLNFLPAGDGTWEHIKTLFIQEMIKNGVLIIASHNFCFAHSTADLVRIDQAYNRTFATMKKAINDGKVVESIKGKSIEASASLRNQ